MDFKKILYYALRTPLERDIDQQWKREWEIKNKKRIRLLSRRKKVIESKNLPAEMHQAMISEMNSHINEEKNKTYSAYDVREGASSLMFNRDDRKKYLKESEELIKKTYEIEAKRQKVLKENPVVGALTTLYNEIKRSSGQKDVFSLPWSSSLIDIEIFINCLMGKKYNVLEILGREVTLDILEKVDIIIESNINRVFNSDTYKMDQNELEKKYHYLFYNECE